jgi:hypothetical protein
MKKLLGIVITVWSMPGLCKEGAAAHRFEPRVEAGYNTPTVVPASRKRQQTGNTVSDETVMYGYGALMT